ncbi:hypothetical protein OIY81_2776 [Cryptosporidium canis]|nr:hypothetical protein OIY81_2776 [Cryptosporidium canis]
MEVSRRIARRATPLLCVQGHHSKPQPSLDLESCKLDNRHPATPKDPWEWKASDSDYGKTCINTGSDDLRSQALIGSLSSPPPASSPTKPSSPALKRHCQGPN